MPSFPDIIDLLYSVFKHSRLYCPISIQDRNYPFYKGNRSLGDQYLFPAASIDSLMASESVCVHKYLCALGL